MSLLHIYIRINVFREQTIVAHLKEQAWSPALLHFSLQARMQPACLLYTSDAADEGVEV